MSVGCNNDDEKQAIQDDIRRHQEGSPEKINELLLAIDSDSGLRGIQETAIVIKPRNTS